MLTARDELRFDVGALRSRAGSAAFGRGEAYARGGRVRVLAVESARVLAMVEGSEDYKVVLTGRGHEIGGSCTCRAFEDSGFCKHMVATGLVANAAGDDALREESPLDRIRAHLKEKGVETLVEMIVGLAEDDPVLLRRLDLAASAVGADDETLAKRVRTAIDQATATRGYVDYEEARDWAQRVDEALDAVEELASGRRAALALELAEYALDRIGAAQNKIDDSSGDCGECLARAGAIHLAATLAVRPDPVVLARALFERETESDSDLFYGAAARYAEVLGEKGLAEYRRLAEEAFAKPPSAGAKDGGYAGDPHRLVAILDHFANLDGDIEKRIALRAKDLSSPWAYFNLAAFCRAHGREDDALRWAEEGLWRFEDDRQDTRLVGLAVDLLRKSGRTKDAEARLWRSFEKAPSESTYRELRDLSGPVARDRAEAILRALIAKEPRERRWFATATTDLLVRVLMLDKAYDAAWDAALGKGASPAVRESLARETEATHTAEALACYRERVETLVEAGGDQGYAEAAALVARMGGLRDAATQAAYVADLKQRFKRRRNFMKLVA
jgi:SWIM zinc finger